MPTFRPALTLTITVLLSISATNFAIAQASSSQGFSAEDHASIETLTEKYCIRCHGAQTQTAGINLAAILEETPLVRNRETWERVIDAVSVEKMPPANAPQPTSNERSRLVANLSSAIDNFDYSTIDNPGFEQIRRLTHREFENTLRDLLATDFSVTDRFPTELTSNGGFDNSANTLFLESSLMERYIAAAERVVELMLPSVPETRAQQLAHEHVFTTKPGNGITESQAANQTLRAFMQRAYRRPPTPQDVDRALNHFQTTRQNGHTFQDAIKNVVQAILISPKFLLRVENGDSTSSPFPIDDWALASRLSYFLWASMPDSELLSLAASNDLGKPEILTQQIDRMLADPRADTLGSTFAAQWLGFQHVGTRIWLDPIDNPWCTDTLMTAMRQETGLFFMSLVRDNQPIRRLLDADYTYVNEELATTLYGMSGVQGEEMRRVPVTDSNRGGILGHGSILALTSNYKDTSPVKRGQYVLDTLLGTPPPPPPPNAGVLSDEVADLKNMSFREKVELHSSNPTCHACHSRIDPIGFSLENFDYFGRWRDSYHFRERVDTEADADEIRVIEDTNAFEETRYYRNTYTPISATGTLPSGTPFDGPTELKNALLTERHGDLVRQTVEKMLSYALGRQLEYYDELAVRTIIEQLEANNFQFQSLIKAIVESYPFRYKKSPLPARN